MQTFDTIIIGAGNAAFGAAGVLRAAGRSVVMIEKRDVGGTCPLRGCVPKKVLVAAAQTFDTITRAGQHHVRVSQPTIDWPALIARERTFVEGVPAELERSMEQRGIVLKRGAAHFVAENAVDVAGERLEGRHIIIASGSRPAKLPIPGFEHTITSEDILEGRDLPTSLVFIGGGVIALEFSHVYARAGTKVTILEAAPRLLPRFDEDAVAVLHRASEAAGIAVQCGVEITSIAPAASGLRVRYRSGGTDKEVLAERVANGAGRVADVEDLDLGAGKIAHEGPRVTVDKMMRSVSNPSVYVVGDALWSAPQLSPVATYAGRLIGEVIVDGKAPEPDYATMPACVYAIPALASVGLTEKAARERGLDVSVKANDLTGWRSARTYAERFAYSKVLVDKTSDRLVGAHIVGHGGEEIINLIALAMRHGIAASDLRHTIFGYPTFSADLAHMI